ncbi:AAA family ATPase, partial [bacterium]
MFLNSLNPVQLSAATFGDGPLLILAGAGSGKTKVLVSRVAYLVLKKGVRPEHIVAVTFTNK